VTPRKAEDWVGSRIKRFREEAGLSLSALADRAGVSKGYLHALENGKAEERRPSAKTLHAVAEALGITTADLLGRRVVSDDVPDIPRELRELAEEEDWPESDVRMLATIQFRGESPRTKERWRYIYNAIQMSSTLDETRRRR